MPQLRHSLLCILVSVPQVSCDHEKSTLELPMFPNILLRFVAMEKIMTNTYTQK